MATIWKRGPYQFCVRVRRKGRSVTKTFETVTAAEEWGRLMDGKISGDEFIDRRAAQKTTLAQAIDWFVRDILPKKPRSKKTRLSQASYWKKSSFASWSLVALKSWDLLAWRREVLDEDNAEDDQQCGPDREFGPQTCVHRLNFISGLYSAWPLHHKSAVENPVVKGVRPSVNNARKRRLDSTEDRHGQTEEDHLYAAVDKSNSAWLGPATRIAIETAIRQAELVSLTRNNVHLEGLHPNIFLPKTKNDHERTVPLSPEAVDAFESLIPKKLAQNSRSRVLPIETARAIGHAFRAVVKDKEFPDLRWHDLRHEAISRLFENLELRDQEIIAIAGHLSNEMLRRYAHIRAGLLGPTLKRHSDKKKLQKQKRQRARGRQLKAA